MKHMNSLCGENTWVLLLRSVVHILPAVFSRVRRMSRSRWTSLLQAEIRERLKRAITITTFERSKIMFHKILNLWGINLLLQYFILFVFISSRKINGHTNLRWRALCFSCIIMYSNRANMEIVIFNNTHDSSSAHKSLPSKTQSVLHADYIDQSTYWSLPLNMHIIH